MNMEENKISLQPESSSTNPDLPMESREMRFTVPWGHIAGKAWGDPCGHPVLCVHGIQDNAGTFDCLIPQLPSFFYYVAIDLPGHGFSSHFPEGIPLNFMEYVVSVVRVLNSLQWDKCYYIGHSLGAQLGLYLSGLWPERVKKLILLDGLVSQPVEIKQLLFRHKYMMDKIEKTEKLFSNKSAPSYTYEEALERSIAKRRSEVTVEAAKVLIKRSLMKNQDGTYRYTTDQRLKLGLFPLLTLALQSQLVDNVRCPVLVILSDLPNIAQVWRPVNLALKQIATKKNFKRVDVEGNHDVHLVHPERVSQIISKFLITQFSSL